jgi:redox-sensitive bicupin YhaK (pirin superfamily)
MKSFHEEMTKRVSNIQIWCNTEAMLSTMPSTLQKYWVSPLRVWFEDYDNGKAGLINIANDDNGQDWRLSVKMEPYQANSSLQTKAKKEHELHIARVKAKKNTEKAKKSAKAKQERAEKLANVHDY